MVCWGCELGAPVCTCEPEGAPALPVAAAVAVLGEALLPAVPATAAALAAIGVRVCDPGVGCGRCGKRFATLGNRNRHLWTHHAAGRRYQCARCPKRFYQDTHRQIHERLHAQ